MRWEIINALIEKNNYKSFLEIGYYKGWSFDQVISDGVNKTAVDPNPCKDYTNQEQLQYGSWYTYPRDYGQESYEVLIKVTSDDFFNIIKEDVKYDIYFIDGLHEAEQVYRDIQNCLKHLSPGGTIVLHDVNPPTYEHTTTGVDGCWTGDTYKAVLRIQEGITNLDLKTVDTDWGVGILTTFPTKCIMHAGDLQRGQTDWNFFDKNRFNLLTLITPEQFKKIYL